MNQPIKKIRSRLAQFAASVLIVLAGVLAVSALTAQTPKPTKQWPTHAPYDDAIDAFDEALTQSAKDTAFRQELTNPATAKAAVSRIWNINIPEDRVIIFYEPQAIAVTSGWLPEKSTKGGNEHGTFRTDDGGKTWINLFGSRSNENVHVFVLPEKGSDPKQTYRYEKQFVCCYEWWRYSDATKRPTH
jgi:hypothetical protein